MKKFAKARVEFYIPARGTLAGQGFTLGGDFLDRYSFSRFLGLHAASKVLDCTTIWRFRGDLANAGVVETLFS